MTRAEVDALRRELVATPVRAFPTASPITFPLFVEDGDFMYVPRAFGLRTFGLPDADLTCDECEGISIPFAGELRDEQRAPVDAFLAAASDRSRCGGILCMYPGFGKTVCAIYAIHRLAVKAMVVVHKDFLLDQWADRIRTYTPTARLGLMKAAKLDVSDKDIVIASLQSLSMKVYDDAAFRGFGLLIIDECHHVGAEVFSRALMKTGFRYVMGLSATPERKDGLTYVIKHHLGEVLFTSAPRTDSVTSVRIVPFRSTDPSYCEVCEITAFGQTRVNLSRMINNVCAYAPRTAFIVQTLAELLRREPTRRVLVLSDRVGHLQDLNRAILSDQHLATFQPGFYVGGSSKKQLRDTEARCRIILATYAMASEGFDLDTLDTLVLASPKSDVEQSVGRIQRKVGDQGSLVLDVVDSFSAFAGQARKRERFYRSKGYKVTKSSLPARAERSPVQDESDVQPHPVHD